MPPRSEPSNSPASGPVRFHTTHWSLVLKAGQGAEEALLKLCRGYWLPLFAYVRRRGHDLHEAQDLTQQFFMHLLQKQGLSTVLPSKGRFRSFLLVSLRHFLDNEWHKQQTLKRGGSHQIISWDELPSLQREALEPFDELTPEKMFDRKWALTLLGRAMKQLENEMHAARKKELFDKLKDHLTGETAEQSYEGIARELNMSKGAVKVTVHRLRRRFGELVRDQVERTVSDPAEIDDELRELLAALA